MKHMKRWFCLLALPLAVSGGVREDYAQQWLLQLSSADAGAYRVTLTPQVYRQMQSPAAKDLVVVNGDAVPVASSLFQADQPLARSMPAIDVPWFSLPYAGTTLSRDVAAISEISADGSLRRVDLQPNANASGNTADETVIDVSRLKRPVTALQIDWAPAQAPFELRFQVMASDDLKTWQEVQRDARLVDLENNGQRLAEHRIDLPNPVQARYLRLVPAQEDQRSLRIAAIHAETAAQVVAMEWQWMELAPQRVVENGTVTFVYRLDGRFPVEVVDIALPGNSTNRWELKSRDAGDTAWESVTAPWMSYRVDSGGKSDRSPPRQLQAITRDRDWQLSPRDAITGDPPRLRLGYRPEVLVFLAEGKGPYALLAGSGRVQRADAPIPQLVDAMRVQRGRDWQPADATPGAMQTLAGDRALTPVPKQHDWKSWLLWALLVGGAMIVAGFAFSLLKKPGD